MIPSNGFFHSRWYHICVASIYIIAGLIMIVKGVSDNHDFQTIMIGVVISVYGTYRLVSRLMLRDNPDKAE